MYLKRLEIQGFKSFADRTILDLQEGLNAVVGPNGSGKSNISDAILWVLGEQSARTLRGSRMEDVIFSGSSTRRPLGLAEVNLILENSDGTLPLDFQEVSIKRRLYRSGDSEYFINNSQCRLKDIHELLVDTGLGKDAYTLIGQGKIDEVLSVRAEDRRGVIDDAAGIVKYKNRKKEAGRKLEDTKQNIIRVQDILNELESQLEPLAVEAEKANQYLIYKTEVDELEIALAVWSIQKLQEALVEQKNKREKRQDDLVAYETQISATETMIEKLHMEARNLDQQLGEKQQELFQCQSELDRCNKDMEYNGMQQQDIKRQRERLTEDMMGLDKEKEDAGLVLQEEMESLGRIRTSLRELEEVLSLENRSHEDILQEISKREKELENKKDHLLEQMNRGAELRHTIRSLDHDLLRLQGEKDRKDKEISKLEMNQQALAEEITAVNSRFDHIRSEREKLDAQKSGIEQLGRDLTAEIETENNKKVVFENQLQQAQSRQRVLEEMSRDYEGYHKGVRSVLLAARKGKLRGKGICGVVSELFSTHKDHEQAVSTALGATLQNIVTEESRDAMNAIEFLKSTSGGRSTFLPLDVIRPGRRSDLLTMVSKEPGIIGIAADLVTCEEKYEPIKEYLLGQIIVASELEHAQKAAQKSHYKIRFVTADGDMISQGGAMSGGSRVGNQATLLGRSREINDLSRAIQEREKDIKDCRARQTSFQGRLKSLNVNLEKILLDILKLDDEGHEYQRQLEQLHYQHEHQSKQMQVCRLEIEEIEGLKQTAHQKLEQLSSDSDSDQQAARLLEEEIQLLQTALQSDFLTREEITAKVTDNKVTLAGVRQKEAGLLEQVRIQEKILKGYRERYQKAEEDLAILVQRDSTLNEKHQELNKLKDKLTQSKMNVEGEVSRVRHDRQANLDAVSEEERRLKRVRRRAVDAQNIIHELDMSMTRQSMEVETVATRLREQHRLSLDDAGRRVTVITDEEELKVTIAVLKEKMESLGAVHLGAVEEQRRVMERYQFLNEQYADLEEAQKGLQQVILEIDKVMKKRFQETFGQVRIRFNEVVQTLFEGGKGDLWLTDPDNLLESGLEITVQPPGKKIQNLSLMSGGEKALTAISLLFAVLMTRPASFCVLDEIDTSLDEANVDRFARFLRGLVRDTQFIVVTHRKGTMETADIMYGVTMEESGVSKLISVRFAETAST